MRDEYEVRNRVAESIQKQLREHMSSLYALPVAEVIDRAEEIVCLNYFASYFDPVLENDIEVIRWADEHPTDALPMLYAIWLKADRYLDEVLEDAVFGRLISCIRDN